MDSIEKNYTWNLVQLPKDNNCIGVKWVYKTNINEKGEIEKYKARLVARGFSQQLGVDYDQNFAPISTLDTIRPILSLIVHNKWKFYEMDVKSIF